MIRIAFMGLLKIELPAATIRLCDGGFLVWGAETFTSRDATFGSLASVERVSEGVGDDVPAYELSLLPPSTAAVGTLSQPGYQKSRVRFWLAEYDVAAGTLVGTPEMKFDGQIDRTTLDLERRLSVSVVSTAERLFELSLGNSLNPSFHKSIWAGETGHDNATGLGRPVAWGVEAPPGYYFPAAQSPSGQFGTINYGF